MEKSQHHSRHLLSRSYVAILARIAIFTVISTQKPEDGRAFISLLLFYPLPTHYDRFYSEKKF